MNNLIKEKLFNYFIIRLIAAAIIFCKGAANILFARTYNGIRDFCWVYRVPNIKILKRMSGAVIRATVQSIYNKNSNIILDSFLKNKFARDAAERYSLAGLGGTHDIFRDVMVLKKSACSEKGVIILKYARTFEAFASIFDMQELFKRYLIVLEPCWAGYCDPSILMFISPGNKVFVQCFTEEDHEFISSLGSALVPVRLGPADWVDSDLFKPLSADEKTYDLAMVANWAVHKRHEELFKALKKIKNRKVRVLLIGFKWGGRTIDDIKAMARSLENPCIDIEIIENLTQQQICERLSRTKAYVFLSWKEGDNKALVEAMFADLPAIIYEHSIGGAMSRLNEYTGIATTYEELDSKILYMLDNYKRFSPREWALKNTGSANSTSKLNNYIKDACLKTGEPFTIPIVEKTNSPNLAYKDSAIREFFKDDYAFIKRSVREKWQRTGRC